MTQNFIGQRRNEIMEKIMSYKTCRDYFKKTKLIDSQLIKSEEKLMMNEIKNSFQFAEQVIFLKLITGKF